MSITSPSPQGSLVAPMLVPLGPVFALAASFVASGGEPQRLVHEAGGLAYVATAASFVVTFVVALLVYGASRRPSRAAALGLPFLLVPWAAMALAMVLGADLVAGAVAGADLPSQVTLLALGSSEIMASRVLGASLVFGGALSLGLAMLVLAIPPGGVSPGQSVGQSPDPSTGVPGSSLAMLVLLLTTGTSLAVLADAAVLRRGLAALRGPELAPRDALLSTTFVEAFDTYNALLAAVGMTAFLGFALVVLAVKRSARGGALLVGITWLAGSVFGVVDLALTHYVAFALERETPWSSEFGFTPVTMQPHAELAFDVACLATTTVLRCGGLEADYHAPGGLSLPPATTAEAPLGMPSGVTFAGAPALTIALDAGLTARELRMVLEAAVHAGYRSLTVVGAWTPPAFLDDDMEVHPMLESQAVIAPTTSWLLVTTGQPGSDDMAPVVVEVRDDDTTTSLVARTSAVADQSVLVVPGAQTTAATPTPPVPSVPPTADAVTEAVGVPGVVPRADTTSGALDPAEISRVIRARSNVVRACFERGVREDPNLGGRVMMRITIQPSGSVSDVVSSSTLSSESVLRCMEDTVRSTVFPADPNRGPVTVSYPFIFGTSP